MVLALNQAARIVPCRYVTQPNVARQGAEERNSVSNEHRHASDNETLNEPRVQEPLNRDPTVDVEVVGTTSSKLRNDLSRRPGHLCHNASAGRGQVDGATTQDHYALVTIWPGPKGQNLLEGLATYHNRIDAGYKLVVAVGFAAARRQPVEIAVRSRNEAVEAGADKDRNCHRRLLTCGRRTPRLSCGARAQPRTRHEPPARRQLEPAVRRLL